jgi:hypothetical protein
MTQPQARFGPSTLVTELNNLVGRIAGGESYNVLDDPLSSMTEQFQLTQDQQEGLNALNSNPEKIAQLKELIIGASNNPASSHFVVATAPGATGLLHELRLETAATGPVAQFTAISAVTIAHCDANCRNWGWGA